MKDEMAATPEDGIMVEFESSHDSSLNDTLCESCGRTFRIICKLLRYTEFCLPLAFLLLQGILLPNFDDLQLTFLVETIGIPKYEYDFLNTITYVAILFFVYIYNRHPPFCKSMENDFRSPLIEIS